MRSKSVSLDAPIRKQFISAVMVIKLAFSTNAEPAYRVFGEIVTFETLIATVELAPGASLSPSHSRVTCHAFILLANEIEVILTEETSPWIVIITLPAILNRRGVTDLTLLGLWEKRLNRDITITGVTFCKLAHKLKFVI